MIRKRMEGGRRKRMRTKRLRGIEEKGRNKDRREGMKRKRGKWRGKGKDRNGKGDEGREIFVFVFLHFLVVTFGRNKSEISRRNFYFCRKRENISCYWTNGNIRTDDDLKILTGNDDNDDDCFSISEIKIAGSLYLLTMTLYKEYYDEVKYRHFQSFK